MKRNIVVIKCIDEAQKLKQLCKSDRYEIKH